MTSQAVAQHRFKFTLRSLLAIVVAVNVVLGLFTAGYRWQAVKSLERQAQSDIYPYGGVYTMASALHNVRTGGESKGWFFVTFLNRVAAVDLSPHNWSAIERHGKTLAVDDSALAMLYKFRDLRSLDLHDTRITDDGLRHLKTLKRLEELDIRGTQITDDGLQKLRAALPNCDVSH